MWELKQPKIEFIMHVFGITQNVEIYENNCASDEIQA